MWPHNFNIVFKWSPVVSALMSDWLLLQLRRGVTSDDQKTLLLAELRYHHAYKHLRKPIKGNLMRRLIVGQITTPFATAFYPVPRMSGVRITRKFSGSVHLLHTKNVSLCDLVSMLLLVQQLTL